MRARLCLPVRLLLVLLLVVLAACGDDDAGSDDAAEPDDASRPAPSEGADDGYPVTIDHFAGTSTFEERPERIVTLNVQWTDAVLAFGEEPVGYVLSSASGETDLYPWQEGLLGDAQRIETTGAVPFEQIAALDPDLILVTFLVTEQTDFDRLQEIAPTIGLLGDLQVDPWQDQVATLGRVLGETETAAEIVADVEAEISDTAVELPGLEGATYVAANWVEGDGIYVIADPDDGASRLFYALGMEIAPEVLALDEGAIGRVQISEEQVEVLDADLVGILTNGSDPTRLPGWDRLTGVRTGALVNFELSDVVGLNTPTPLSIPHVLDLMRPALDAVVAAR